MNEKSEALRLAECLDEPLYATYEQMTQAAAELRRLSVENDLLASAADKLRMSHSEERMELLRQRDQATAQRDALLVACRFYASMMGRRTSNNEPFYMTALDLDCGDRARAAIKAVEENT